MRRFIRLGDKTSHGGTVTSASSRMFVGGIPVACIGDTCTCPKKGHNNCVIVEGDDIMTVDGRAIALEGCKCSCGAVLISSMPNAGREYDGGSSAFQAGGRAAPMLQNAIASTVTAPFDEQLQFLNAEGQPYAEVRYLLHLANGETAQGQTDVRGRTARIATNEPTSITRADLYYAVDTCCARHAEESKQSEASQIVELQGVETNPQNVGSSVAKVTPPDSSRPLSQGEIAMCKLIFRDSIDYSLVKVHNHEYLWFGLQHNDTAITPNGEIYFNPKHFKEDFSSDEVGFRTQLWFVHEMVHVWQKQLDYPVLTRGAIRIGLDYEYTLEVNKLLSDYNMEAQGNLLADYWALKQTPIPPSMYERKHRNDLTLYENVLRKFIQNPADKSNLPGGGDFDE